MRRFVLLLVVTPLLTLGCSRQAPAPEPQPSTPTTPAPKPKPAPPSVQPSPPTPTTPSLSEAEKAERFRRFKEEALAARKEKDLRAEKLALENALQYGDEADLKARFAEVRTSLNEYDAKRQRAAALRKDPAQLEAAILALEDAKKAWDTPTVRQEIDDYTTALLKRRDLVGVADFELRGDVGDTKVGRTIAEELQPSLKQRFDLVERARIVKALADLKIQAGDLAANLAGMPELADALKARYMVLGSVTRFGGWIANARLVDLRTGLVVQTGKITALTPEGLFRALPQLGKQLLMSDEERQAFEQEKAKEAPPAVAKVREDAPIPKPPPPPPPNVANAPPAPPAQFNLPARPPGGDFALLDLNRFPVQPPIFLDPAVQPLPFGPLDFVVRARLLRIAIDLGDQFLFVGRFADAQRQYQLAFSLAPDEPLVQVRLNNLALLGVPVAPVPLLSPLVRPRVVIFDFLTSGDPRVVPPILGPWTAENLAPYFVSQFEVVDRGLAYWYMARMGLSLRDVAADPSARFWLGRALNVRYFVFGALTPAASFHVTTRMVDAELNYLAGQARLRVRDPFELKLRLGELTQVTLMNPIDRAQYEQGIGSFQDLLAQGHRQFERKDFDRALKSYFAALALQPGNVEVMYYIQRTRERELAGTPGRAEDLLERERRRGEIRARAGQQLAIARGEREGKDTDFRKARQEMDRKAAERLVESATKLLNAKSLNAKQSQQARDMVQAAGRLHKNKTADDLVAKLMPRLSPPPAKPGPRPSADFDKSMKAGQDALATMQFLEAEKRFAEAKKLSPDRPEAAAWLSKAREKRQAEFKRLFDLGKANRVNKRYGPAMAALNEALKLQPGDPVAKEELKKAEDGRLTDSWMEKGRAALSDRNYANAVKLYTKALEVIHDEPDATKALKFAKGMLEGSTAFKQEKYKKAADAFREARDVASKSGPFYDRAQQILNQAEYRDNMAEGNKALKARRRDDAIRYFEAALRNYPNDLPAKQALQEAKKLKSK